MKNSKVCNQCLVQKPVKDFYIRKGEKLTAYCKDCTKQRVRAQNYTFKQKCLEYKQTNSCTRCGYNNNQAALDFHHVDLHQKEFEITRSKSYGSKELKLEVKAELDKCIVLCANCHREIHNGSLVYENGVFREVDVKQFIWISKEDKPKKEKPSKQLKSKTVYYKIQWPTEEEMARLVWEKPLSNLAEDLGVSDKSIAKFCLKNSIEKPPRGYWLKTRPLG